MNMKSTYSNFGATPRTPQEAFRARVQTGSDVQYKKQPGHLAGKRQYKSRKPKSCKGGRHHRHEAIDCTQCPLYRNAVLEKHFETLKKLFHLADK